jgi:hypothetical protein
MPRKFAPDGFFKVKVTHDDLLALGVVGSRYDQTQKIRAGKLRPPNKDGDHMQSSAWWYWADIVADLEREQKALEREQNSAKAAADQPPARDAVAGKKRPAPIPSTAEAAATRPKPKPPRRPIGRHREIETT